MEWRDQAVVLGVRPHGETSVILDVVTQEHGRHLGIVRGGTSRKLAPVLQPGNLVDVSWRGRLEEHIGSYQVEPITGFSGRVLSDRLLLSGLNALCSVARASLAERLPCQQMFKSILSLMYLFDEPPLWPLAYLRWELDLLSFLGFGLQLGSCAVTGRGDDLVYISPKSGTAVSRDGAGDWASRLLPLPPVLLGQGAAEPQDVKDGLDTTGFFLKKHVFAEKGAEHLPRARSEFLDRLARQGNAAGK